MQRSVLALVLASVVAWPVAAKGDHHKPQFKPHKPPVVVVKPGYKPHKPHYRPPVVIAGAGFKPHRPFRHRYKHRDLRNLATFAVLAGVTYAVIDNLYYRKQGSEYVYVSNPPVANSPTVAGLNYVAGQRVAVLPVGSRQVMVDGIEYYQCNGTWFAPIAGSNQFVVISSPL